MTGSLRKTLCAIALLAISLGIAGCSEFASVAEPPPPASEAAATAVSAEEVDAAETIAIEKINLNDMTREDLLNTIPDFGNRMVREFFEYQPYISIQQFRSEMGKYVDEEQVAFYEEYVYVPVDVNESDAETLKQIPGVDDAAAETLMAARPFASNDVFLAALADHVSAEQLAAAASYLQE